MEGWGQEDKMEKGKKGGERMEGRMVGGKLG